MRRLLRHQQADEDQLTRPVKRLTDYYVDPLKSEKRREMRDAFLVGAGIALYLNMLIWSAEITLPPRAVPPRGIPLQPAPATPDRDRPPPIDDAEIVPT